MVAPADRGGGTEEGGRRTSALDGVDEGEAVAIWVFGPGRVGPVGDLLEGVDRGGARILCDGVGALAGEVADSVYVGLDFGVRAELDELEEGHAAMAGDLVERLSRDEEDADGGPSGLG